MPYQGGGRKLFVRAAQPVAAQPYDPTGPPDDLLTLYTYPEFRCVHSIYRLQLNSVKVLHGIGTGTVVVNC